MRKKLYRNLTALVLMFALAMGTLLGTRMDVMAANNNYAVDITSEESIKALQNVTFEPGDNITYASSENGYIAIWVKNDKNSTLLGNIYPSKNSFSFPDTFTLGEKTYTNPKWKFTSYVYSGKESNRWFLNLWFEIYNEEQPDPTPEENPNPALEENPDTTAVSKASTPNSYVPSHECSFQWVTTVDPQPGVDGLEEYKCMSCGMVKESQPIPASMASVKNLYGFIKDAPENGTVTTDFGKLHTISDYLLKKMAERNDATVTIQFEYKNQKLQITFPAGTDYTPVLTDTDTMYGFYGVASKLGLAVTERQ